MFGHKRKEQRIGDISSNIATLIEASLWPVKQSHAQELPKAIETDEFVLGYIFGVGMAGAFAVGMRNATDRRFIAMTVFEYLFPGKGQEVSKTCIKLSGTEKWNVTNKLAIDESEPVFKTLFKHGLEPADTIGALASLDKHLDRTYS